MDHPEVRWQPHHVADGGISQLRDSLEKARNSTPSHKFTQTQNHTRAHAHLRAFLLALAWDHHCLPCQLRRAGPGTHGKRPTTLANTTCHRLMATPILTKSILSSKTPGRLHCFTLSVKLMYLSRSCEIMFFTEFTQFF